MKTNIHNMFSEYRSKSEVKVTSGRASDEHPMSTRWASDGGRWKEGGKKDGVGIAQAWSMQREQAGRSMWKYAAMLVMLFTLSVGQMWGAVTALTIPKSWASSDGKSAYTEALGCTQSGLGKDYSTSGRYLRFDDTGDYLQIQIASAPAYVSYSIQGNSFSSGTFKVQESANGTSWSDLATYSNSISAGTKTHNLAATTRYIRFYFTTHTTGNVGMGTVVIKARTSVTLDKNGGSADGSAVFAYGAGSYESFTTVTRTGYTLNGYYTASSAGTKVLNVNGSNASSSVSGWWSSSKWSKDAATAKLYAQWAAKTYSITLDRNGASSGSTSVTMTYNSSSHTAITAPTRSGYTFDGWYDSESNDNGTGNQIMNASGVLQANAGTYTGAGGIWILDNVTTLYAKWTADASCDADPTIGTASLNGSFNSGGVTSLTNTVSFSCASITPGSNCAVAASNYGFIWYSGASADKKHGDDGVNELTATTAYSSGSFTKTISSALTVDQQYTFRAWATNDKPGTVHSTEVSFTPRSVAFNPNGGSAVSTKYIKSGGTITSPGAPATPKTGYTFDSWRTDAGLGTEVNFSNAVNASTTYYAKWNAKTYAITLDGNGATSAGSPASVNATYDAHALSSAITNPRKTDYIFQGWNTKADGSGLTVIGTNGELIADVSGYTDASGNWTKDGTAELYAKWQEHTYTNYRTSCCTPLGTIDGEATLTQGGNSVTISGWSTVSNVGTYTVKLYKKNGANWDLVSGSTSGGAAGAQGTRTGITEANKSVTFTGLVVESEYKFTVQAIAGSAAYCDGDETDVTNINSTDVSSTPFKFRYSIYIDSGNGSGWAHHYIEPTGNTDEGSVAIDLSAHVTSYQFKIFGGFSGNWGQTGEDGVIPANTKWTLNGSYNVKLNSGAGGSYTFTVDYSGTTNPGVTVTYPSADQASGYKIYFDKSIIDGWGNTLKYRIGNNSHNQNQNFTLVPGTDQFYVTTTPSYGSMDAWQIANNVAWTPGNSGEYDAAHGIYNYYHNGDANNITRATVYQDYAVDEDITIAPTSKHNTENYCDFWDVSKTSGMLTHTATITTPSHGTINIAYTNTSGTSCPTNTSTVAGLAHRTILTITATPDAGYSLTSLTVGGNAFDSGDEFILNDDATIEATFTAQTSTVTLDNNDATSGSSQTVTATYDAAMPLVTTAVGTPAVAALTRTGYTFNGWWDAPSGGNQYYTYSGSPKVIASARTWDKTGAQTLKAQWTVNQYMLTWDLQGGTVSTAGTGAAVDATGTPSSSQDYGTALEAPIVTKNGYTFNAWSPNVAGTMPAENTTYTASWTAQVYNITYKDQGDNAYSGNATAGVPTGAPTTHTYGAATALVNGVKDGYRFDGWFTDASCTVSAGSSIGATAKTADFTLYAKWTATSYILSYDLAGGSVASPNPTSYTIESSAITLNNPTKAGYTFAGWTGTGLASATETVTIAAGSTGNRSYTATWTAKTDTYKTALHTDASGWTSYASGVEMSGANYDIPAPSSVAKGVGVTCEDTHYHFAGWVTDANKEAGTISGNIIPASGKTDATGTTYWAVWEKESASSSPITYTQTTSVSVNDIVVIAQIDHIQSVGTTGTELDGFSGSYATGANFTTTPAATIEWTVVEGYNSTGVAFKNGDNYLYWESGNSLATTGTLSANSSWTVTTIQDASSQDRAQVANNNTSTRKICWNQSSPRFAAYEKNHGLNTNQYYWYPVFYKKSGGITYDDPKTVCEACVATPTISSVSLTGSAFSTTSVPVQATGASAGANCTITDYGFCWGTSAEPTGNSTTSNNLSEGTFSATLTGTFTIGTMYYYRAYATNEAPLTGYSSDGTFTLHNVTFNMHDHGAAQAVQVVPEGGKVANPGNPSEAGWTFDGWWANSTYSGSAWDFSTNTVGSGDLVLHAKWTEKPKYTITLNAGNGTVSADGWTAGESPIWSKTQANGDEEITLPAANPGCAGWVFKGWKQGSAATDQASFTPDKTTGATLTPTGNVTYYAVYRQSTPTGSTYTKITESAALTTGDYAIVANNSGTYEAMGNGISSSHMTETTAADNSWSNSDADYIWKVLVFGDKVAFYNEDEGKFLTIIDGAWVLATDGQLYTYSFNSTTYAWTFTSPSGKQLGYDSWFNVRDAQDDPVYLYKRGDEESGNYFTNPSCSDYSVTGVANPAAGGSVQLTAAAAKNGDKVWACYTEDPVYKFHNWSYTGAGASISSTSDRLIEITVGSENVEVTANFDERVMYTVTWSASNADLTSDAELGGAPGSSERASTSVETGEHVTKLPPVPTSCETGSGKSDVFVGWSTTQWNNYKSTIGEMPTGTVLFTSADDAPTVSDNVTYYAVWAQPGATSYDYTLDFEFSASGSGAAVTQLKTGLTNSTTNNTYWDADNITLAGTVYQDSDDGGKIGPRLGASSSVGSIEMPLLSAGQVAVTSIVANVKGYGDDNTNFDLTAYFADGTNDKQTLPSASSYITTSPADYTANYSNYKTLTKIKIEANTNKKRLYVCSITVNYKAMTKYMTKCCDAPTITISGTGKTETDGKISFPVLREDLGGDASTWTELPITISSNSTGAITILETSSKTAWKLSAWESRAETGGTATGSDHATFTNPSSGNYLFKVKTTSGYTGQGTYRIGITQAADETYCEATVYMWVDVTMRDKFVDAVNANATINKDGHGAQLKTPAESDMDVDKNDDCSSTTRRLIGWIKETDLQTMYGSPGETGYLEDAASYNSSKVVAPYADFTTSGATWYAVWGVDNTPEP